MTILDQIIATKREEKTARVEAAKAPEAPKP